MAHNNKVLLIHNIMWSHYKAKVFSELNELCNDNEIQLKIIQIAYVEKSRKNLGNIDYKLHNYDFEVFFRREYKNTDEPIIFFRLLSLILKIKPNIVVLPGYSKFSSWMLAACLKFLRIKTINVCDSTLKDFRRTNFFKEAFKKQILKLADLVFCYGKSSKAYLLQLNVPENKIHIRCQATDNEIFENGFEDLMKNIAINERNLSKTFLYVGRFSEEKNLINLLKAFKQVEILYPEWHLTILGDGPLKESLINLAKELNLRNLNVLKGMSFQELIKYYALSTCFILPSISEPWGIVVNEAMLCESPILVSENCGCADELVIEGKNGFKFDPYSMDSIYGSMKKICDLDDKTLIEMGLLSKQIIKDYSPKKSAMMMLDGFNKLLKPII